MKQNVKINSAIRPFIQLTIKLFSYSWLQLIVFIDVKLFNKIQWSCLADLKFLWHKWWLRFSLSDLDPINPFKKPMILDI